MKLHQLIESDTVYGAPTHTSQLVDLTLKEIVDGGKVTNPYQLFVLAKVSGFFKNGLKSADLKMENPVNYGDDSTSAAVKEALLKMKDAEHVKLAKYLLDCLAAGECMLHNKEQNVVDWMKFVTYKQD
jgi:hypothetical protein